jgi:signal transduction histidine kinase
MRLGRLWENRSLGIQLNDAGREESVAAFEGRARRHARSLVWKCAAAGLFLVTLLWVVIIATTHHDAELAYRRAANEGRNLSAAVASESTRMIGKIFDAMDAAAARIGVAGTADAKWLEAEIERTLNPPAKGLFIDTRGKVLASTLPISIAALDFGGRTEFTVHMRPNAPMFYLGPPILADSNHLVTLPITRRIDGADGKPLGVLLFSLSPVHVTHLHREIDLGRRGVLMMVCSAGVIRARFTLGQPDGMSGVGTSIVGTGFDPSLPQGSAQSLIRSGIVDNVTRLNTFRRLDGPELFVGVGVDIDDVLAASLRQKLVAIAVGAAVSLLIAALTILLLREIWRRTMREIELAAGYGRLENASQQMARDRERLAEANAELIRVANRADMASQAKSQFIANMSHELRTPLHAIIGFSELIKERAPRTGQHAALGEYAADILASGRHLLDLINTVLDLSKVESGTALLNETTVSVADIINASLIAVRSQSQKRNISVLVSVPNDVPQVRVDVTKIRQVLINLLSNAVKFTPEGGSISLSASIESDHGVAVTVTDTGIGMTDKEITVAMEPFGQVDSTLSRSTEGTGLGLPLARRLIELHGGTLSLTSDKGKGTTARMRLPPDRVARMAFATQETAPGD